MKKKSILLLNFCLFIAFFSCDKEDIELVTPTGDTEIYNLSSKDIEGIKGTVSFIENSDKSTTINLDVTGISTNEIYSASLHFNTILEGGEVALSIGLIDPNTGKSSITISTLDDNTQIIYEELINFDGHINIYSNEDTSDKIIAQADIGKNQLTGNSLRYDLGSGFFPSISGEALFYERKSGESLAIIKLLNASSNVPFPAFIYTNTIEEEGEILFSFNPLSGNEGISMTNIRYLDNGVLFSYEDLFNLDGNIKIHLGEDKLNTILAQGNIGSNE